MPIDATIVIAGSEARLGAPKRLKAGERTVVNAVAAVSEAANAIAVSDRRAMVIGGRGSSRSAGL